MIECVLFGTNPIGFALPLFAHPTNSRFRLVQEVDEISGGIRDFRVLEAPPLSSPSTLALSGPFARKGDDIVYAFIDEDGSIRAGGLKDIEGALRNFSTKRPEYASIRLQILELVGSSRDKKHARSNMRQIISDAAGSNAARAFYEGSILQTALWQRLVAMAPNAEFAARILSLRSRISACVMSNGSIDLELSALNPDDIKLIDQARLLADLYEEFDPPLAEAPEPKEEEESSGYLDITKQVSEILNRLSWTGRQEERVAILLEAILKNREVGLAALERVPRDRGKFANWAIHELRSTFAKHTETPLFPDDHRPDKFLIAKLVPKFFTQTFSMQRGLLLWDLARHLGGEPEISAAIQQVLKRTRSGVVQAYSDLIQNALKDHSRKRKARR